MSSNCDNGYRCAFRLKFKLFIHSFLCHLPKVWTYKKNKVTTDDTMINVPAHQPFQEYRNRVSIADGS